MWKEEGCPGEKDWRGFTNCPFQSQDDAGDDTR